MKKSLLCLITLPLFLLTLPVTAGIIHWTDWQSSSSENGFTALGSITSGLETINVEYNNPIGIGFIQTGAGGDIDYWQNDTNGRDPSTSPYTSPELTNGVDNIPTGTDIIALEYAGTQTLTFSQSIANPFFSYVSLNGNGYAFDQDFEILSVGGVDGNDCGYWGCGTSSKEVVDLGNGNFEYRLVGTGEPHGTLRFTGTFDSVSWSSLTNEYWNGFTVGVEGTAAQVFPCQVDPNLPQCSTAIPEPSTISLLLFLFAGMFISKKKSIRL